MSLPKPDRYSDSSGQTFRRPEYLKLTEGEHYIRFLNPIEDTKMVYTHWIKKVSIECVGVDCPVCIENQQILDSVNGDRKLAKEVSGFSPYQVRYYANVLDRTQVKVHPDSESGYENKRQPDGVFPHICGDTAKLLEGVSPTQSNKVKILAGGVTLFNDLDSINSKTGQRDAEGNITPIGVENFDIILDVKGTGRERKITPVSQVLVNDVVSVPFEDLYDLDAAIITLEVDEILDLVRGISLKDIFSARRAVEEDKVVLNDVTDGSAELISDMTNDITKTVEDLLG